MPCANGCTRHRPHRSVRHAREQALWSVGSRESRARRARAPTVDRERAAHVTKSSISMGSMYMHRLVRDGLARSRWDHQPGDSLRAPASGMAGQGCKQERLWAGVGRETMLSRHAQGLRMGYPSSRRVQPAHSRRDGARARRFQNLCGTSGYRVNSRGNPAAVRGRRSEYIIARPDSARHRHATLLWGARPASRRRMRGLQSLHRASGRSGPDR